MKLTKSFSNTLAALAFCAVSMAMSPAAHAGALYESSALVQITLINITGGTLGSDVLITYRNAVTGQDATSSGLTSFAVADPYVFPGQSPLGMEILDTLEHDHIVLGEAGYPYGTAYSSAQSEGYITMENLSFAPVDFEFEYSILASVDVNATDNAIFADAFATAIVEIFDDTFTFANLFETLNASLVTGVPGQNLDANGTFRVTVNGGSTNNLSVLVDTNGGATFVPEPETLVLLIAGLLGIAVRRKAFAI